MRSEPLFPASKQNNELFFKHRIMSTQILRLETVEMSDDKDVGTETEIVSELSEHWNNDETFRLIALYKEYAGQWEDRCEFWKFMQKELLKYGINRTSRNIRTKWNNLLRTYKSVVRKASEHIGRRKFAFYKELDDIWRHEPYGSAANEVSLESIENSVEMETILVDDDEEGSEIDFQNDTMDEASMASDVVKSKRWHKSDYYRSKISELEDRRRFRQKKLQLAVAKEERKIRQLALKEKQFELSRLQYELDERRLLLDERKGMLN